MKIVIDSLVPFTKNVFEPYAEVEYINGNTADTAALADADALISSTAMKCTAEMLADSPVKIIANAAAGRDNIDTGFCSSRGIFVQSSSGCNSGGVMNYVFSALYGLAARKGIDLTGKTFGIIGVGSVGSRVETMARALGFKILRYDSKRAAAEGSTQFTDLDQLLALSDIVSLHVPLDDETRGMADSEFFASMKSGAIFINASRGELVVDDDLIQAIPRLGAVVIDTWNGEPDVNRQLLELADIATPHIAGLSYQGMQNATMAAVRSVARFFDIKELFDFFPPTDIPQLQSVKLDVLGLSQGQIASMIQYNYPIFTDDFMFRMNPSGFERIRAGYQLRKEFFIE